MDQNELIQLSVQDLMKRIRQTYPSTEKLSEDILFMLHTLFPLQSVSSLDLCDHRSVSLMSSPSSRKIYSCLGSSGTPYLVSYSGFLCSCPSFRNNFSTELPWCKHLVAVHLSIAMDIVKVKPVSEDMLIEMLSESFIVGN